MMAIQATIISHPIIAHLTPADGSGNFVSNCSAASRAVPQYTVHSKNVRILETGSECFHILKQKTTKITVNFPKIIKLHLNSSSQCIQLAMRQVNKREKNPIMAKRKIENNLRSL
jgi:hypothetical protein